MSGSQTLGLVRSAGLGRRLGRRLEGVLGRGRVRGLGLGLGLGLALLLTLAARPAAGAEAAPASPLTMPPSAPRAPVPHAVLVFPADAPDAAVRAALEEGARGAVAAAGLTPLAPVAALEHHLVEIGCDAPSPRCLVRLAASVGAIAVLLSAAEHGRIRAVLATASGRVVHGAETGDGALGRAPALFATLLGRARADLAAATGGWHPPRRAKVFPLAAFGAATVLTAAAIFELARRAATVDALNDPMVEPERVAFLETRRTRFTAGAIGLGAGAVLLTGAGIVLLFVF